MLDDAAAAVIAAARNDADTFAELMQYDQAEVHRRLQQYLAESTDATVGMPRGHGKSVQAGLRYAWEIGRNPSIRIWHIAQTDEKASEQVRFVAALLQTGVYKLIFPDVKIEAVSATSITAKRPKASRDATLRASGIFGRAGGRADLLAGDDVCDLRNSILVPAERQKVKEAWYNNWLPMRAFADGQPRTWRFFTPYHTDDLTAEWKRKAEDAGNLFWEPCRDGISPWPEVWTPERLAEQRAEMGPLAYARAYELVPISSDSLIFRPEWLEAGYYRDAVPDDSANTGQVVAAIDWAFTAKASPKGDYSVCAVGLLDRLGRVWMLDCLRMQATFPDFMRKAIELCERLEVALILAEGNGPQAGLCQQLAASTRIPVNRLARTKDKITRASEAQPAVEQGKLRLRCRADGGLEPSMQPIRDEMIAFPAAEHDDTVDGVVDLLEHARSRRYDPQNKPATVRDTRDKLWRIYGRTP
jgi:predicted phage terminase large subunit-like protein